MTDQHSAPVKQELLYDPSIPTPTDGERARTLVGHCRVGTLSTLALEPPGHPYGSLITYAVVDDAPVFLVSALAEHTKNLSFDPRCSLLVAEMNADYAPGKESGDMLALGRVTVVGSCNKLSGAPAARAREGYIALHPNAAYYVDFKDFAFWALKVESLRYIGGFGRMSWDEGDSWRTATVDPLAPAAAGIIEHMNDDHADALVTYCLAFSTATEVASAKMTLIDRYGFEMSAETEFGRRPIRVAFDNALDSTDEVRPAVIALLKRAREITGA